METNHKKRTGEKIKEIRKSKGLTQKKLAELCNMYESQIRKYESGSVHPKIETLQKIADALCVPVTDLRSDLEIDIEKLKSNMEVAMNSLKNEVLFLNFLLSLGYEYIDTFHDNEEGYDRCIHVVNENVDIPLTREEYEKLKTSIANDTETEIYKIRKDKGI